MFNQKPISTCNESNKKNFFSQMQRSGSLRKCRSFIVYWQVCRKKNDDVNSETLIQFNFRYKFKLWRLYTFFCFFFWFEAINLHVIECRVKNNTKGSFTDVGSKTDYWLKFFQSKITVTVLLPSTFATEGFLYLFEFIFIWERHISLIWISHLLALIPHKWKQMTVWGLHFIK